MELAANNDPNLRAALRAEIDRTRMGLYEKAVRRYMVEVRKSRLPPSAGLPDQHNLGVRCAEKYLPMSPLHDYGVARMIDEARASLSKIVNPTAMAWLPDVRKHFKLMAA